MTVSRNADSTYPFLQQKGLAEFACPCAQRRYDMRYGMLTQRALCCHHANTKRGTLSQHSMTACPVLTVHRQWPHVIL